MKSDKKFQNMDLQIEKKIEEWRMKTWTLDLVEFGWKLQPHHAGNQNSEGDDQCQPATNPVHGATHEEPSGNAQGSQRRQHPCRAWRRDPEIYGMGDQVHQDRTHAY